MKLTTNKVLFVMLGAAVLVAVAYAFIPKPISVDVVPVVRGPLIVSVAEDGRTRIKERYVVAAPLAGQLVRTDLKAGDKVDNGKTLLAAIEPSDPELLDSRTRALSQARVKSAEAGLQKATPELQRIRSIHEFAVREAERAKKLFEQGVMSRQELDGIELQERASAEEFQSAEYSVQIASFELEQARAVLIHTRLPTAEGTEITRFEMRSPINGRVLRVFQESAAFVATGTPLLEIGDPADIEVEVDLLSTDAVKIAPGGRAFLEHWGGSERLQGRVRLVEPAGFTKISALGVEEQRVWVKIDFTGPPENRQTLGDAYRVEARIVVWESNDVLKVPVGALFRQGDEWAVFILEDDQARLRTVTMGHINGLEAEVLEGLDVHNQVILHPSDRVQDGVSIVRRRGTSP